MTMPTRSNGINFKLGNREGRDVPLSAADIGVSTIAPIAREYVIGKVDELVDKVECVVLTAQNNRECSANLMRTDLC